MIAVLLALLVVVVGLVVAVVLGRIPVRGMEEPVGSSPFEPLPEQDVQPDDVDALRFDQVLRGYRMSQVDGTLDTLRGQLERRDARIADLQEQVQELRHAQSRQYRPRHAVREHD